MISTAEINKQVFQTKKEIGLELRCRREKKGLSLAEAASVCGLSPNRIMRIENGYAFSFRHIFMLAAVYGRLPRQVPIQWGFDGVVITDAMNMGAIAENYSPAEASVKAVLAGADMILMPEDFVSAYEGVLEAVRSGVIDEARINDSLKRVYRVKYAGMTARTDSAEAAEEAG